MGYGGGQGLGSIIKSFFKDGTVVSRGCPQGSALGPVLWIAMTENWFSEMRQAITQNELQEDIFVQAFADDQLINSTTKESMGND